MIRIAVTGGAGQIAYSLLFRIGAGEMFGPEQPIALHILDLPDFLPVLEGVRMELEDCAFPLLQEIHIGSDPYQIFKDVDFALLVGAKPRGPGMERKDLLQDNAKIFVEHGKALNEVASPNVRLLVVGNPCNTNCLIALHHAPRIPRKNFFAMTRLDQNRATSLIASKAKVSVQEVTNLVIWGNHSSTQVPDYVHAKIKGKSAESLIRENSWWEKEFMPKVQKRGAAVIAARGKSSAASAANAIVDTMRSLLRPTPKGDWYSLAVYSEGNSYGIDQNLLFSFPCRTDAKGEWQIVQDLSWNDFLASKIRDSEKELLEEREMVQI